MYEYTKETISDPDFWTRLQIDLYRFNGKMQTSSIEEIQRKGVIDMKVRVRVKRPGRKPRALAREVLRFAVDFLLATASGVVASLVYDWLSN